MMKDYTIVKAYDPKWKGNVYWLVKGTEKVGYIIARPDKQYIKSITISDIEIKPRFRGQGLSKVLFNHIKKEYPKENILMRVNPKEGSLTKEQWKKVNLKGGFIEVSKKDKYLLYLPRTKLRKKTKK